jgi:Flp pilus assembly pilin Flp
MRWLRRLIRQECAATAVEYAVMLAGILLVIIGTIGTVGTQAGGLWGKIMSSLSSIALGH